MPSPIHQTPSDQTTEMASAALTVGRQAIPTAMTIWMPAKPTPASVEFRAICWAHHVMASATPAGLP